jgi:hypothetical protein
MLSLMKNINGGVLLHCFGEIHKWRLKFWHVGITDVEHDVMTSDVVKYVRTSGQHQ